MTTPISPGILRFPAAARLAEARLQPVFVIGCQRSGSTMLGAMLGGHPGIVCIPEAQFIVDLMPKQAAESPIDPTEVIDRVARHWRFRIWDFDLRERRPAPGTLTPTYRAAIEWLVRTYADDAGRQGARVWVDQQPGHVLHVWKLLQHFPDARFIHIVRDGRAVAASIMACDWGPNQVYSAARYWQQRLAYGYAAAAALGPERVLTVRYEDLLERTEPAMRCIAAFLGVEFAADMLTTSGLRLPEFTRYQHQLIGAQPRSDRAEGWRRTMSQREIEIFEAVVGDLLPLLGYEPVFGRAARPLTFAEKLRLTALNEAGKAVNAARFGWRRLSHRS